MQNYDVIIVGGGPVGVALGLELGMLNIKTAIIEKHDKPLMLPRAQLINPRSMEFFRRWGISQTLVSKKLLPHDFPLRSTWCTGLAGEVFSSIDISENINVDFSPEKYQRIPLWITETVLRDRLLDFHCVQLIKNIQLIHFEQQSEHVIATLKNCKDQQINTMKARYLVACDGADSRIRQMLQIEMQAQLPSLRMMNITFTSQALKEKMTVPKGILYYNLTLSKPAAIGCIDYENSLWYANVSCPGTDSLNDIDISSLIEQAAGFAFQKDIHHASFWSRDAKIANQFRKGRIFLAGDAAHALPPTGGHGLNTGFGDAVNLGWKLAAVLHGQAGDNLLDSYEIERKPVAMRNIKASTKNAEDASNIRKQFPPETMPEKFALENERIAKQHSVSPGIALGYHYQHSPIVFDTADNADFGTPDAYSPSASPGFFAPHFAISAEMCLYDLLKNGYTLIATDAINQIDLLNITAAFSKRKILLKSHTIKEPSRKKIYTNKYYLLRPDWHIAWTGETIPSDLEQFLGYLMPK